MLRRTWFISILVVILVASLAVMAQQPTTGTLAGKVVDNEGKPLPGATISITGPGGDRSAQTDAQGDFEFRFVPAGTFKLKVDMAGFAPMQFSTVPVNAGQTTRVPVKLLSGKTEEVTVTSATPIIDVKRVGVQTTFKTDTTISTLPIGRNFVSAVAFAPGVVSGGGTGAGNYSISGSSGLENSYLIDGVNITSSGYGGVGTYSQSYGSLGTGITSDFLEEVQVKTAGFEAEYGQALGGVITGTVKSGTNDLKGRVNVYFSPRSLEAYGTDPTVTASNVHNRQRQDIGLQAGGPIVKDRLFWFVAYNPVKEWNDLFVGGSNPQNPLYADELTHGIYTSPNMAPASTAGGIRGSREYQNYAAKLNAIVTPNHRIEATFFGDPSKGYGSRGTLASDPFVLTGTNADGAVTKEPLGWGQGGQTSTIKWGADQQALKYNGLFGTDWFLEMQVNHRKNTFKEISVSDYAYTDYRANLLAGSPDLLRQGGIGFYAPISDKSMDYALKLTKSFGNHEVKAGVQYFDLKYFESARYSGPVFTVPFPAYDGSSVNVPTTTGASVQVRGGLGAGNCDPTNPLYTAAGCASAPYYRVTRTRFNDPGETTGKETSMFVQDTWSISDKWTLKVGVRSQSQKLTGSVPFSLPFSRDTEHPGYYVSTPTTYEPKSYKFAQEWSPRLGLSFDPSANGKTKIYANYARYFERVPSDLAIRQFSNEVGASRFDFTDPYLSARRGSGNALLQGVSPGTIADGTKLPYKDEFVVGWQQLVRPDLSVEVRGVYRKQGRILEDTQSATVEDIENYYYGNVPIYATYDNAGHGVGEPVGFTPKPFPAYTNDAPFQPYNLSNPGENAGAGFGTPKLDYKALEIQIEKRLSDNWAGFFNYRYSILKGNYEGLFRNDNGQSDPNITSLFDFPNSHLMRGQFQAGFMNNDRPHVLHLGGTYFFKNGLEAGGIFNWQSGIPRTPLLAHPNYGNAGELPGRDPVYAYLVVEKGEGGANTGNSYWATGSDCSLAGESDSHFTNCFLFDYTDAPRGSNGRVPDLATIDLHLGWKKDFKDMSVKVVFDVTNVFNAQEAQSYNDDIERTAATLDPNYLQPTGYQAPRSGRISVIWDW